MLIRIVKTAIGILLLPVAVAVSIAFIGQLGQIEKLQGISAYFLNGVIIYLIIHLAIFKPNYFYVFAHETAHALATFICGGAGAVVSSLWPRGRRLNHQV